MTNEDFELKIIEAQKAEDASDYKTLEAIAQELEATAHTDLQKAEVHRLLGVVASLRGDSLQALERLKNAELLALKADDRRTIARIVESFGNAHIRLSDYPTALECYSRALSLHEELREKSGIARETGNIGNVYRKLDDYAKALEYYGRALSLHEELGEKSGIANVTSNIGNVYTNLSDYSKALEYYSRALSLHDELGEKSGIANVIGNIGIVYRYLADYPKALEYDSRALSLLEELGEKSGIARVTGNIGIVYVYLADCPKALEYYGRALSLHEELGEKSGIARVTGNIGAVYTDLADYTKALDYYRRALSVHEELGEKSGCAIVTGNIGIVYSSLSDYPKALEYFSRALNLHKELGAKSNIAIVTGNIGELYANPAYEGYDATKAEEYLSAAVSLFEEIGEKRPLFEFHQTLAKLFEHEGQHDKALQHFKKFYELEKEVLSEEAKKKADQLDYERLEAEREKQRAIERARDEERLSAQQNLLNRMLPPSIAQRLLDGEHIADYYRDISILFADIVGFTSMSSQMPAHVVLRFLNYVFGVFDAIMKEHGCEKIKTIGDGYMAVAGAPQQCEDHAERLARAALAMQQDILLPDDIREHFDEGTVFSIRIGLHCGAAVGGIIGDERFVFDVHSDAVNLAARMEQSSESGKIHVSSDFAMHLQNRMNLTGVSLPYKFTRRGQVEIKGKGVMRTYYLEQVS